VWCVVVRDLETSWMRRPWPTGRCRAKNKQTNKHQRWRYNDTCSYLRNNTSKLATKFNNLRNISHTLRHGPITGSKLALGHRDDSRFISALLIMPADNYRLYTENAKWKSIYLSEAGLCLLPVRKFSHWTLLNL